MKKATKNPAEAGCILVFGMDFFDDFEEGVGNFFNLFEEFAVLITTVNGGIKNKNIVITIQIVTVDNFS